MHTSSLTKLLDIVEREDPGKTVRREGASEFSFGRWLTWLELVCLTTIMYLLPANNRNPQKGRRGAGIS